MTAESRIAELVMAELSPTDLVARIASDPAAVEVLRTLVEDSRPLWYTTETLAARTGRSPRAIAAAIRRGELPARRQSAGPRAPYVIAADDAENWQPGVAMLPHRKRTSASVAQARHRSASRPLRDALSGMEGTC
jgi:hypothetical protein